MTPDDEKRVADIRERLAKRTPGSWLIEEVPPEGAYNGGYNVVTADGYLVANDTFCAAIDQYHDAALIANAPDDLSWLLSLVEELGAAQIETRVNGYRVGFFDALIEHSNTLVKGEDIPALADFAADEFRREALSSSLAVPPVTDSGV